MTRNDVTKLEMSRTDIPMKWPGEGSSRPKTCALGSFEFLQHCDLGMFEPLQGCILQEMAVK